ncbi:MAG: hypothetical protein HGA36_02875 [Candidatus Moranbacteria bacterium]|nr:hypothetical protein [Candidatus Moranbacteria bacterium]
MLSEFVLAAPSVSTITPVTTFSHGLSATVSGAGFGVKQPVAPIQSDYITNQSAYISTPNGGSVPVGAGYVWNRKMQSVNGGDVFFRTDDPRGKQAVVYTNEWSGDARTGAFTDFDRKNVCGDKMYLSWWMKPYGDLKNAAISNKLTRLVWDIDDRSDRNYVEYVWNPFGFGGFSGDIDSGAEKGISFNPNDSSNIFAYLWWEDFGVYNAWNRQEVVLDNSHPSPNITLYPYATSINIWTNNAKFFPSTQYPTWVDAPVFRGSLYPICNLGSIGADFSNTPPEEQPIVDFVDIYWDNTVARVEICNNQIKNDATHCEIQTPHTTWSDGTLQITINQGLFVDGATAYLFVMNADGSINSTTANSTVTFSGGSSDIIAPSAPGGLNVM